MNNNVKILLSFLIFLPFSLYAQQKDFEIIGEIGSLDSPFVISIHYKENGKDKFVEDIISKGFFRLKGVVNNAITADLMLKNPADPNSMASVIKIWLEPGIIQIKGSNGLIGIVVSGTINNDLGNALAKEKASLSEIKDNSEKELAQRQVSIRFIQSHPNAMISLVELDHSLSRGVPELSLVESLFNGLSPELRNSEIGKNYFKKLQNWKKVDVGSIAPDFTQPDRYGKTVKLSNFKGKYVLIDFWASWCHPCRDEHPNLINQYNAYKDKNFTILSVSIDGGGSSGEKGKALWLQAIKDDKIGDWTHVSDLTGEKNQVRAQYGVGSIPENFLIDPTGKIIAKSLRGEALNQKLKEIFQQNFIEKAKDKTENHISDGALTLDTAVRTGQLANGFTYFIRKNDMPKKQVLLYLANKVGSVLEEENQQGLAHFMEHMNFNGTTHFPKNELINYLQKAGIRFGADINAYTGFNETVYQLPLPSDKPDLIKNGIQIMRDWAKGALLETDEINKERGVILEEKRVGAGPNNRVQQKTLPVLMNHSRYSKRLPIGIDSVLINFDPETLRKFYRDWYRPDLQALIVVGDVDVDETEKAIKSKFSDLLNPENAPERKQYTVPLLNKNQFVVVTDPEVSKTQVSVRIKNTASNLTTKADYRRYMIENLFNIMLKNRLLSLSDAKNNPPFVFADAGVGDLIKGINGYSLNFEPKQGMLENSFKLLWTETERLRRYGFLETELNEAKTNLREKMERSVAESGSKSSTEYANAYSQYFLNGIAEPGLVSELKLTNQYLNGINTNDLGGFIKKYLGETNMDIIVVGPESEKSRLPTERQFQEWIDTVKNGDIEKYQLKDDVLTLLKSIPKAGKVVKEQKLESIKAIKWTLSNGAKVILKPTNFDLNDISISAFSPGGTSLYSDADYPSASFSSSILSMAGLGTYSYSDLAKFLGTKNLGVYNGIGDYETSIGGFSGQKDLELLFQVIHAKMANPVYSKEAFNGFMEMNKINRRKEKSPEEVFSDTIVNVLFNNSVRKIAVDSAFMASVDLDKAYRIYKEQYGNPSNFTFVCTGSFTIEQIKPLFEKYIASLSPSDIGNKKYEPKNLGIYPPSGELTKLVYKGSEKKSSVNLSFNGAYSYNVENNKLLDGLKEILQIRITNRLREDESGTYSPSVAVNYDKIPENRYRIRFAFDCAPENVDKLIAATLDEIEEIKANGPSDELIEKFKAEDQESHRKSLVQNQFWLNYIQKQVFNNEDLGVINKYEQILKGITKESLRDAAQYYLSKEKLIKFILMPESYKNKNMQNN